MIIVDDRSGKQEARYATPDEIKEHERITEKIPELTLEDRLNALMQYIGVSGHWNGSSLEVVKTGKESGDYTNPIMIPVDGITVEFGKWYYTTDKELPHEAKTDAFVTPEDFYDSTWFDFVE